jgi:hypothetical protein
MVWHTTREEDLAYCLMGLFSVNMPIIYGEDLSKALKRLQLEITQNILDHSIFAWRSDRSRMNGLLARSPTDFAWSGTVRNNRKPSQISPFRMTNFGIEIQLRISRRLEDSRVDDGMLHS